MALARQSEARERKFCAANAIPGNVTIGAESPVDFLPRERLLDAAFGAARFQKAVERLRTGRLPAEGLALVAKEGGQLVGTLRLWHIRAGAVPALLLGPLAVAKAFRCRGIGRALMEDALRKAARFGHAAILLVGDAGYYEPFGFSRHHTLGLIVPGAVDAKRFLGLELKEGALKSAKGMVIVTGPSGYGAAAQPGQLPRAA